MGGSKWAAGRSPGRAMMPDLWQGSHPGRLERARGSRKTCEAKGPELATDALYQLQVFVAGAGVE